MPSYLTLGQLAAEIESLAMAQALDEHLAIDMLERLNPLFDVPTELDAMLQAASALAADETCENMDDYRVALYGWDARSI